MDKKGRYIIKLCMASLIGVALMILVVIITKNTNHYTIDYIGYSTFTFMGYFAIKSIIESLKESKRKISLL